MARTKQTNRREDSSPEGILKVQKSYDRLWRKHEKLKESTKLQISQHLETIKLLQAQNARLLADSGIQRLCGEPGCLETISMRSSSNRCERHEKTKPLIWITDDSTEPAEELVDPVETLLEGVAKAQHNFKELQTSGFFWDKSHWVPGTTSEDCVKI